VIVAELNVIRVAVVEPKADAPLIIDRDRMLPRTVAFEGVEPVPGGTRKSVTFVATCTASSFRRARRATSGGTRRAFPVRKSSSVSRSAKVFITLNCNA
jgi:hypothetical protein